MAGFSSLEMLPAFAECPITKLSSYQPRSDGSPATEAHANTLYDRKLKLHRQQPMLEVNATGIALRTQAEDDRAG